MRALVRNQRVVYRAYADGSGGVLLNLDSSMYFAVNAIGGLIWQLMEALTSDGELVERLQAEIPDVPSQVIGDVAEFLDELSKRGLIHIHEL